MSETQQQREAFEARFWARVDKSGECWTWKGCDNGHGYGTISYQGRPQQAHRASWEIAHGPVPEGLFVCHRCDNPPCVRPDHLFVGTHHDNMMDAKAKGRLRQPVEFCPKGHPYEGENVIVRRQKGRNCRACDIERKRAEHPGRPKRFPCLFKWKRGAKSGGCKRITSNISGICYKHPAGGLSDGESVASEGK